MTTNLKKFSPLIFLAPLGAGGLSVAFFAFMNYTLEHGKGLINFAQTHNLSSGFTEFVYSFMEFGMAFFTIVHIVLTLYFGVMLLKWLKTDAYKELMSSPLTSSAIFAPFVSITMTMNVMIGSVRYFFPVLSDNLQVMMLPGLIAWLIILVALMRLEIKVLKESFLKGFDLNKIHFGWLMQPFALGMVTVTGTGIAAMAQSKSIADVAIFMSLMTGTMALFLLMVKMITIFKSQFKRDGLPEKQFLPSILIIVPNITILSIAAFRFGHYLEHHQGAHLQSYFMIVMTVAFAIETWYMAFGISLLSDYMKKHLLKEFHVSQWGMICPFVAYSVMGSFVYKVFLPYAFVFWGVVAVTVFTIALYIFLLTKQYMCFKRNQANAVAKPRALSCS